MLNISFDENLVYEVAARLMGEDFYRCDIALKVSELPEAAEKSARFEVDVCNRNINVDETVRRALLAVAGVWEKSPTTKLAVYAIICGTLCTDDRGKNMLKALLEAGQEAIEATCVGKEED